MVGVGVRELTLQVSAGIPLRTPSEAIVIMFFFSSAGDNSSTAYPEEDLGCRERK